MSENTKFTALQLAANAVEKKLTRLIERQLQHDGTHAELHRRLFAHEDALFLLTEGGSRNAEGVEEVSRLLAEVGGELLKIDRRLQRIEAELFPQDACKAGPPSPKRPH